MRRSAPGAVCTARTTRDRVTSSTGHGRGLATQKRRKSNASAARQRDQVGLRVARARATAVGPSHSPARIAARTSAGLGSSAVCIVPARARALGNRRRLRRGGRREPAAVAHLRADHDRHRGALRRLRDRRRLALAGLPAALRAARDPGRAGAGPPLPAGAADGRVADRARRRGAARRRHVRGRAGRPDPGRDRPAADPQRGHEGRGHRRCPSASGRTGSRSARRGSSPAPRWRSRSARRWRDAESLCCRFAGRSMLVVRARRRGVAGSSAPRARRAGRRPPPRSPAAPSSAQSGPIVRSGGSRPSPSSASASSSRSRRGCRRCSSPPAITDETAGWLLARDGRSPASSGSALLPAPLARRGAERAFLRVAAVVAAAGCVFLALAPARRRRSPSIPLGIVLLGSLPVILELTERRSPSSAATALIWLAGNAGGIVVAVLVQTALGSAGRRVLAAGGDRRARARVRLKEAAAAPRTRAA